MNSETFGELIRKKRIEKRLALRELANKIDLDQSTLSKVERNELIAPPRIINSLSASLGLEYKDLQIKYLSEKLYQELKDWDYSVESLELAKKRIEKEKTGTNFELERKKLVERIEKYLSNQPIEKAWLFGSFAREEESYDSDIDLLIRFRQPHKIDLFEYVGMRQDLEDITGRQVDLVEEGQELPKIRGIIEQEKRLIYERKAS